MNNYKLTETEAKFAEIIWANQPIGSPELVRLCEAQLNWKKSTTYTMLKRLETKGIFQNNNGTVIPLLSKDEFYAQQSKQFVADTFGGSLPRFLAAFSKSQKLSKQEIKELERLIQNHKEES